jgi:ATP-dependent helicase/nuclease subunit B
MIIITPNRRLAATLHQQYQQFQLKKSRVCWLTPDILPLNTWLQRLYEELLGTCFIQLPQLLTTAQEKYCWEQIILHSDQSQQLLQIA